MIEFKHTDDGKDGRFTVFVAGTEAGYIKYQWIDKSHINANGTLVYEEFRDQKLGTPLFNQLVDFARAQSLKIFPTCPFVVKTFKRHPELNDLLADDYQA